MLCGLTRRARVGRHEDAKDTATAMVESPDAIACINATIAFLTRRTPAQIKEREGAIVELPIPGEILRVAAKPKCAAGKVGVLTAATHL